MNFKINNTFENRRIEAINIMKQYPSRVPIICKKCYYDNTVPDINKYKYLVPRDLTVGQFIYTIRCRLKLSSEKVLFLVINNIIPSTSELIGNVYNQYHDADNFLYITYTSENTFG
jgi:GABA(A) receptor-associated protein